MRSARRNVTVMDRDKAVPVIAILVEEDRMATTTNTIPTINSHTAYIMEGETLSLNMF